MDYVKSLLENNKILLLQPLGRVKDQHNMKCLICHHEWSATPISKMQAFKNRNVKGCPSCNKKRQEDRFQISRAANKKALEDRGFEILCDWDGRRADENVIPIPVTVKNLRCGHTFTSTVPNLLVTKVECAVCGPTKRVSKATEWSKSNSKEWQETAGEWLKYKAKVTSITKQSYKQHKTTINPDNHERGIAGVPGAYHLDHIIPVRYCFDNNIPAELCGHHTNLQMLPWFDNVSEGATLKKDITVPTIFDEYIQ